MTRQLRTAAYLFWLLLAASCAAPTPQTPAPPAAGTSPGSPDPDIADRAAEKAAERAIRRSPLVQELETCLPAAVDIAHIVPGSPTFENGSGSLIHEAGYILTVNHVPLDGSIIVPYNGKRYRSRVIASVPGSDLAIGKVDAEVPLPYLPLGESASLTPGEPLFTIGSPGNHLVFTISTGTLIARAGANLELPRMVSFGNSGGPVLDSAGRQVGIVQSMTPNAAVGHALEIDSVRQLIAQGLSEAECGVRLGLTVDPMSEPKITGVRPGSPAEKAGLLPGDVLTRIASFRIGDGAHYYLQLAERKPGENVTVVFRRGTETRTAQLTVEAMPSLGISVKGGGKDPLTVGDLGAGSPAVKAGFKSGDVIETIDGKKPTTLADVVAAVQVRNPGDEIAIEIVRDGQKQLLKATLGKRPCKGDAPRAGVVADSPYLGLTPGLEKQQVSVSLVAPGSPADRAGVKVGDVITAISGKPVKTVSDLISAVQSRAAGDKITIEILRGGQKQILTVTLGKA